MRGQLYRLLQASPGEARSVDLGMAHQELYARADALIDVNGTFALLETKAGINLAPQERYKGALDELATITSMMLLFRCG